VGVMPREGGSADVRWFEIEPCYVFHPLNAYDDGPSVVLDVVRHATMFDNDPQGPPGPDAGHATLDRWTVDLDAGKVRQDRLDDRSQEFPRIDERLVGSRHRYGYSMRIAEGSQAAGSELLRHDLVTTTTTSRSFGPGTEVGEFVFVPRDADSAEDDGALLGLVYDAATQRSDLAVLDAASLDTMATVRLPARVPNGFHGNWCPTA
ncbi:MAG: carotenoid oxygenase family protein, partial [Nocardioidaceae bacterium]